MNKILRRLLITTFSMGLAACGSMGPAVRDGAPQQTNNNLDAVADAVPKYEPLARYGNPESYTVFGVTYYPLKSSQGYSARGTASWYGTKFHGALTSSREPYDMYSMTAAHKTLPLPTYVRVTNLDNNKSVVVRVNDRGPFHSDRVIDLSYTAAYKLGMLQKGTARVEVQALQVVQEPLNPSLVSKPVYLQVGAFGEKENAEQMRQRLLDANIVSGIKIASNKDNNSLFRVHLGPFNNREEAIEFRNQLDKLGVTNAHVVGD